MFALKFILADRMCHLCNALVNHAFSAFTFTFAFMAETCARVHVRVHPEILRSRSFFLNSCVRVHARVHQNMTDHKSNHKLCHYKEELFF